MAAEYSVRTKIENVDDLAIHTWLWASGDFENVIKETRDNVDEIRHCKVLAWFKKMNAGTSTGVVMTDFGFHIYTGWTPDGLVSA